MAKKKIEASPAAERNTTFKDNDSFNIYMTGYNHAIEDAANTVAMWKYHKGDYQKIANEIREMRKERRK